jgi:hypothetical protein
MVTGISTTKTGFNARFVFRIIIGLFHLTGFMNHSKSQTIQIKQLEDLVYNVEAFALVAANSQPEQMRN